MILKRDSKRIKELEKINVQHRKLNGKLRQEIDILESQLDFITYQNIVIENLQKENERLKEELENKCWDEASVRADILLEQDDYKSKIEKVNKLLNANTHVENIYHGLCNLFDETYQYEIDNEEILNILEGGNNE